MEEERFVLENLPPVCSGYGRRCKPSIRMIYAKLLDEFVNDTTSSSVVVRHYLNNLKDEECFRVIIRHWKNFLENKKAYYPNACQSYIIDFVREGVAILPAFLLNCGVDIDEVVGLYNDVDFKDWCRQNNIEDFADFYKSVKCYWEEFGRE